jgi:hypothetical protein
LIASQTAQEVASELETLESEEVLKNLQAASKSLTKTRFIVVAYM